MENTNIQWCDSTVNPIMGCNGCELYPAAGTVLKNIDRELRGVDGWQQGTARIIATRVINEVWQESFATNNEPGAGHLDKVSTTNIRHLRLRIGKAAAEQFGRAVGKLVVAAIERSISCYAAQLHANRGFNIEKTGRKVNSGYAPTFEQITRFPSRLKGASSYADLSNSDRSNKPWLNGLPRTIFVSDMGDAFSRKSDFNFLREETQTFETVLGRRHLWLWLTKRPHTMREFSKVIGGFPSNVCAMTTVTSRKTLGRIDALRNVDAQVKGLSIEPLFESIVDEIDLDGIDWVIVGGESGALDNVAPFELAWAAELRELCLERGIPFFLKQLGRRPVLNGVELNLADKHGGDWLEWPEEFRVREMPEYFKSYPREETFPLLVTT